MAEQKGGKKGGFRGGKKSSDSVSWGYLLTIPIIMIILVSLPFLSKLFSGDYTTVKIWLNYLLNIWRHFAPFFIVLNILLLGLFIYLLFVIWAIKPKVGLSRIPRRGKKKTIAKSPKLIKSWEEIMKKVASGSPENLRLAIVAADALVDAWLKKAGYQGNSFADRVSVIQSRNVKSFEAMWRAHRLRNDLVHTPGFALTVGQAQAAIAAYGEFLKEMGAL